MRRGKRKAPRHPFLHQHGAVTAGHRGLFGSIICLSFTHSKGGRFARSGRSEPFAAAYRLFSPDSADEPIIRTFIVPITHSPPFIAKTTIFRKNAQTCNSAHRGKPYRRFNVRDHRPDTTDRLKHLRFLLSSRHHASLRPYEAAPGTPGSATCPFPEAERQFLASDRPGMF